MKNHFTEEHKRRRLIALCPARWVQRHDAVIIFKELYMVVCSLLQNFADRGDATVSAEALGLHSAVTKPVFIVTLCVAEALMAKTLHLSKALQSPTIHLAEALDAIDRVVASLQTMRSNSSTSFRPIFSSAEILAKNAEVELVVPRRSGRQVYRNNTNMEEPIDYFRVTAFIPFIDHLLSELMRRFADRPSQLIFQELLPALTPSTKF